jgi:hypothetical protein
MDQLGEAAAAVGGTPRIPSAPPQRRTEARTPDNVRNLPATFPSLALEVSWKV